MPRGAASGPVPELADLGSGWRAAAETPECLLGELGQGSWVPLQSQPGRATFRCEDGSSCYFVKRYLPTSLSGRVRDFVARRKPQLAFARGRELLGGGVGTPEPLGLFLRGAGIPAEALLVTEWVADARLWTEHLARSPW